MNTTEWEQELLNSKNDVEDDTRQMIFDSINDMDGGAAGFRVVREAECNYIAITNYDDCEDGYGMTAILTSYQAFGLHGPYKHHTVEVCTYDMDGKPVAVQTCRTNDNYSIIIAEDGPKAAFATAMLTDEQLADVIEFLQ